MAETFGSKFSSSQIREMRKQMGLSQTEVATLADVSRRTVQHAESSSSSVKPSSLQAIANVLDLELQGQGSTRETTLDRWNSCFHRDAPSC